jgi:O-antigen/teichoic acid export membrane protein
VLANLDNLMNILPPEYSGGAIVIIIIGAANIFDMAAGINGAIILNSEHYRFDLYSMIVLIIITVTLNYLLIPPYGIMGAAIGTASAVIVYNILKLCFVWIRFSMQPFEWKMLIILFIGTATLFLISLIPTMFNLYIDLLIRSAIVTLIYGLPLWMMNISEELNQLITGSIDRLKKLFV